MRVMHGAKSSNRNNILTVNQKKSFMEDVVAHDEFSLDAFPKSCLIPNESFIISPALFQYLTIDEMILPKDAYPPADSDDDGSNEEEYSPRCSQSESVIRSAIEKWESVCVKCDHVAPSDALWMMPFGSLKCLTLGHVYMALKVREKRNFIFSFQCTRCNFETRLQTEFKNTYETQRRMIEYD